MQDTIKIATWNICLGLKRKKDYISDLITREGIDICCIQECELEKDYPDNYLTFKNYKLETETCVQKRRCCIYINNKIDYQRRQDLEDENNHLVILDINLKKKYRLINIYRTFAPQDNTSPSEKFAVQLDKIQNAIISAPNRVPLVIGDFNLDGLKLNDITYCHYPLFQKLTEKFDALNLTQLIKFATWSRLINGTLKTSTLDHVYTNDKTIVNCLNGIDTEIGDHKCITFTINEPAIKIPSILKRDWRNYSKTILEHRLSHCMFELELNCVQDLWNSLENTLVTVIDEIVPMVEFTNNQVANSNNTKLIRCKVNHRRRLLKKFRSSPNPILKQKILSINHTIKEMLYVNRVKNIRRNIIPGNAKSLWNAVKIAKDINVSPMPSYMLNNEHEVIMDKLPDQFAKHFKTKVGNLTTENNIQQNVYNGRQKIYANNYNFMDKQSVIEAISSIKIKNCEGYDRIPQRILVDGIKYLSPPLIKLFDLIYKQKEIPEHWLISKTIPILKKGNKNCISNYRPISNLCSCTKIFEKLILMRLKQLEKENNCDITGNEQHGFKTKRSTNTAGLLLQSILSHSLDQDNYALMASLDLSAAFDVVNIELLLKRLKIIGLPPDIRKLIRIWLEKRMFYVTIDGNNSYLMTSDAGTVQGSTLGPILYAIFVSPLFDIEKMTNYADDNYVIRWNKCLEALITDMEKSLEAITKWLKDSGLIVNTNKTEICLFYRKDIAPILIMLNGTYITSKPHMKVLGIIFDSKLQWHLQVANTINKSKSALHSIKIIRKYFTQTETLKLLTSNFYSILYYNSEIWNTPALNNKLKQNLLSASASALKTCTPSYHRFMSFQELHQINNRATPTAMSLYKHALLLYNAFNDQEPPLDWIDLSFQQTFNTRCHTLQFVNSQRYKIGSNSLCNRFKILNGLINFDWLNLSKDTYKLKCKALFLTQTESTIPNL